VITIDGHRVRFTHPLLAVGVYAVAPPADRRGMHRRLAGIAADPEERARHLAQPTIHHDAETTAALDEGAVRARSRGAPAVAAELLELAIKLGGDTPSAGSCSRSVTSTPAIRRGPARCWRKRWPGSLRVRPGPKRRICWPWCACMTTVTGNRRVTCSRHSARRARICGRSRGHSARRRATGGVPGQRRAGPAAGPVRVRHGQPRLRRWMGRSGQLRDSRRLGRPIVPVTAWIAGLVGRGRRHWPGRGPGPCGRRQPGCSRTRCSGCGSSGSPSCSWPAGRRPSP
jgi:hypothetical protein